jgi:sRNA-binding protein
MTKNHNVVAMLAARFPQTFVADSSRPHRPLKLGINRDLVALGVLDEASATRALRHYCSRLMYRRSLVAGGLVPRHRLEAGGRHLSIRSVSGLDQGSESRQHRGVARAQRELE